MFWMCLVSSCLIRDVGSSGRMLLLFAFYLKKVLFSLVERLVKLFQGDLILFLKIFYDYLLEQLNCITVKNGQVILAHNQKQCNRQIYVLQLIKLILIFIIIINATFLQYARALLVT